MSARAAAQLELLNFNEIAHYLRGKTDWIGRGLPTEPPAPFTERIRRLPFFINNLYPDIRQTWIRLSRRKSAEKFALDPVTRIEPQAVQDEDLRSPNLPLGVVLNREGVLLGAVEQWQAGARAMDIMNPSPQTIRPDMTYRLASHLLRKSGYLIVSDSLGRYQGVFLPPERRAWFGCRKRS